MVVELPSSMESPDSPSYISSPEVAPKRSNPNNSHKQQHLQHPDSASPDDKEKSSYVRFLVSNAAAGSIIGKGGSTITNFQLQSGARIQLSRTHEYFPGTSDRIIMISGALNEIIKAMEFILTKLQSELHAEDGDDADPRSKVKLIIPNSTCGGIIGKGGSTIKSFIEESQAGIKISPQDHSFAGLHDRLVIVTGSLDQQIRAVFLILSKLTEDPHYPQSVNAPFSYSGVNFSGFQSVPVGYMFPTMGAVAYNAINFGSNGAGGKFPNNKGLISPVVVPSNSSTDSTVIHIPDEHIGAVVGRGGRNLMEITQASGARIRISDRGDFISGTSDRKVTITGSKESIRIAEAMIRQKSSNSDRY